MRCHIVRIRYYCYTKARIACLAVQSPPRSIVWIICLLLRLCRRRRSSAGIGFNTRIIEPMPKVGRIFAVGRTRLHGFAVVKLNLFSRRGFIGFLHRYTPPHRQYHTAGLLSGNDIPDNMVLDRLMAVRAFVITVGVMGFIRAFNVRSNNRFVIVKFHLFCLGGFIVLLHFPFLLHLLFHKPESYSHSGICLTP